MDVEYVRKWYVWMWSNLNPFVGLLAHAEILNFPMNCTNQWLTIRVRVTLQMTPT
jgi:hypothetical protein